MKALVEMSLVDPTRFVRTDLPCHLLGFWEEQIDLMERAGRIPPLSPSSSLDSGYSGSLLGGRVRHSPGSRIPLQTNRSDSDRRGMGTPRTGIMVFWWQAHFGPS